jgi:hypothetical protein
VAFKQLATAGYTVPVVAVELAEDGHVLVEVQLDGLEVGEAELAQGSSVGDVVAEETDPAEIGSVQVGDHLDAVDPVLLQVQELHSLPVDVQNMLDDIFLIIFLYIGLKVLASNLKA